MNIILIILSSFSIVISLKADLKDYTLIFAENFNSAEKFESNWDFEIGAYGTGEKQYCRRSQENIFIENNQLHIKAIKNKIQNKEYTSGRLTTKNTFQFAYGYVKTRMKLPKAKGIWPAFRMIGENIEKEGWPKCGEIDIMEAINDNDIVLNNLHWFDDGTNKYRNNGSEIIVTNKDEFHVYELLWEEDYIKMFIDEKQTYIKDIENITTNAFTKNFYFILNLAVGGDLPGNDIDDSKFPLELVVDYIEVYQKKYNYNYNPKSLVFEMAPEFNPWKITKSDNIFIKEGKLHLKDFKYFVIPDKSQIISFKYGELKMKVSLPDAKGIISKIYLFNRELIEYYIRATDGKKYLGSLAQLAIVTTKDGSGKIIPLARWEGGEYYKEIEGFKPTEFNEYLLKWDEDYITIFANDIEIYKIYLGPLPDFKSYFFMYFENEKIGKYSGKTPEIVFKELKLYQYKKDTVVGLSNDFIKLNIWLFIIFLLFIYF